MKTRFLLASMIFALILAACGSPVAAPVEPEATPEPVAAAVNAPEPTPEQTRVLVSEGSGSEEEIVITAIDGLKLAATFYPGQGEGPRPGVLLLHMLGSNRGVWQDFANQLNAAGYSALALDMRGHGDSGSPSERDWNESRGDVLLAWQAMSARPDVDGEQTAVIGGSIGANMALFTGANEARVDTVVLLSPGLDYRGVTTDESMAVFGERAVLIVASEEDSYAADSSRRLLELAADPASQLQMYDGAGHGTNMLGPQPELADLIVAWLNENVVEGTPAGEAPPAAPGN